MSHLPCPKCANNGDIIANDSFFKSFYCPACQFSCFMKFYRSYFHKPKQEPQEKRAFASGKVENGVMIINQA